jgi:VWFA-related protein
VCAAGGVLAAQSAPPQEPPQTFRATTRLVHVSVVVHDGRGAPVAGLTAADFQLFDKGAEQQVSLFTVEAPRVADDANVARAGTFFTNRVDGVPAAGVTVLLFDRVNTRDVDQSRAREHVIRFLGQLNPRDRVAFYVLESNTVRVLHDFTSDAAALVRAIRRVHGPTSPELAASEEKMPEIPASGDPAFDAETAAWIAATEQKVQGFYTINRAEAATAALESIARRLAGVRGRKNLIWVSSGFPLVINDGWSTRTMGREITKATQILNAADIAVYPVDARGLQGAFATDPGARNAQFATLGTTMPNIETMTVVADRTGGRAFFNTNDLGTAILRAATDSRLTYVLGYYPSHNEWDGRFRDIKVKVRRPGVDVRHRTGYLALPNDFVRTAGSRRNAMIDALSDPIEATGIGLAVGVDPSAAGKDQIGLNVIVDAASVALENRGGTWNGALDLAVAQTLPDGRLVRSVDLTLTLQLTPENRERALKTGLPVNRTIALRPDAQQVRVAAYDPASGAVGSIYIDASKLQRR